MYDRYLTKGTSEMKFKVGDKVKYVGWTYGDDWSGVVTEIFDDLPFPVIVDFHKKSSPNWPCLEEELELVK